MPFWGLSSRDFFLSLCNFLDHISPDDDLLFKPNSKKDIRLFIFLRQISCNHLTKNKNLYTHIRKTLQELYKLLSASGDKQSDEVKNVLEWKGYDSEDNLNISTSNSWIDFTRRICYFLHIGITRPLSSDSTIQYSTFFIEIKNRLRF